MNYTVIDEKYTVCDKKYPVHNWKCSFKIQGPYTLADRIFSHKDLSDRTVDFMLTPFSKFTLYNLLV